MPILSFADQTTADIYAGINSKAARRVPQRVWTVARRKLQLLNGATSTLDLGAAGGNRFEPLATKPGYNSIRVNDQYRLIFQFANGDSFNVYIEGEDHTGRR